MRSFSYNDPSSTSFHRALTRYEMAPGARPCFRKKRRSDKSRVVLYRCSLFPVTATGAVSGQSAASGVRASGRMEEEVAMALWLSVVVLCNNLKCQGYYWPQLQFWLLAVQMLNQLVSVNLHARSKETSLGSGVTTSPVTMLIPAVSKKVAVSLYGLLGGLAASLRCLAIVMRHMCLPYILIIPWEVECLIVASSDYLPNMKYPSA